MSEAQQYRLEQLDASKHGREDFKCESSELTGFLRKRARKEMQARASACFVLVPEADPGRIAGYYTLSQAAVVVRQLPEWLMKKLPRDPQLGATLIGRPARDIDRCPRPASIFGMTLKMVARRSPRLMTLHPIIDRPYIYH